MLFIEKVFVVLRENLDKQIFIMWKQSKYPRYKRLQSVAIPTINTYIQIE